MPVYEYLCVTCGNAFEHFVRSFASAEPAICPKCGGAQVNKQFSTFATKGSAGSSSSGSARGEAACSPGGG
jgi:putative FmdB family regulatory protein